jgi:ADP-ribose pyrophosphatase
VPSDARFPAVPAPGIGLTVVRDHTTGVSDGFLRLRRADLVAHFPDGTTSAPFVYDRVERRALDAVAVAAHFERDDVVHVYLRTAVRPPLAFRHAGEVEGGGNDVAAGSDTLWELPAGLIEPDESPAEAGARELAEELGFEVEPSALVTLGAWMYPLPAVIAERHVFFAVAVDPLTRTTPREDGSALERFAAIEAVPLGRALDACRAGAIRDEKTELALRRLEELVARPARERSGSNSGSVSGSNTGSNTGSVSGSNTGMPPTSGAA